MGTQQGTYTFGSTGAQIIQDALALLSVYGIGLPVQVEDQQVAVSILNRMLKSWQSKALHLWKQKKGYLFFTQYTAQYDVGTGYPRSLAYAADSDNTVITYNTVVNAIGDSTITVASVTNISVGDTIGVVNSSQAVEWFTVSSINTNTKVITLSGTLTHTTVLNQSVYTFSSPLIKPMSITSARRVSGVDMTTNTTRQEITIKHMGFDEFNNLPVKTLNSGTVVSYTYNPYDQWGRFEVWPRPNDCTNYLQFNYTQQIQDITVLTDIVDAPVEWEEPIVYGLAARMVTSFGKMDLAQVLIPLAERMYQDILANDSDNVSIYFRPGDETW